MTPAATGAAPILDSVNDILKAFARAAVKLYYPETDEYGNPSLIRFFLENGRVPFLSDETKPWKYRGWMIPVLQTVETAANNQAVRERVKFLIAEGKAPYKSVPYIAPRYDYLIRTLEAGKLLDEPIPQIHFVGEFEQATKSGMSMINKCLNQVQYKSGYARGISDFCEWLGFALGVTTETSGLDEDVQKFLYENFNLELLMIHPSDYLGQILTESQHGKRNGFFPTPIHICHFMAELTKGDVKGDRRSDRVTDPCVGTGRMLLVASNFSMRLSGMDIDSLCCLITKINLALYAPWFYIPDSFFENSPSGGAETVETTKEAEIEVKTAPEPLETKIEAICELPQAENPELSQFEKLRLEKEKLSKRKKHTTEIENLPLFDFK